MSLPIGYKQTEIGVIPENWRINNLKSECSIKARIGWQGLRSDEYLPSGEFYLITGTDFEGGYINWKNCSYVTKWRYDQDNNIQFKDGDVLITKDGTIGKVAYICDAPGDGTLNSGIFVIRPFSENILPVYLQLVFKSLYFDDFINKITAGSTIVHLYQKDIVKFLFPIPPIHEQKSISNALIDIDALISVLNKKIEKKKLIKQGAMQQLLTGKRRLPGFTGLWKGCRLGEVSLINRGGSPRPIESFLTNDVNGINWIKIGDVKPNAKYITSTEERIIPEGVTRSRKVCAGDFILSNSMSFGRPYILQIDGCIHDGWLVIQNYQKSFNTDFLYYLLGSEEVFTQYKNMAAGSSVQNLNKEKVSNVFIEVPTLSEQIAIAEILSDMDKEISELESKKAKHEQIKQGMMQQLLTGKIRLI